MERRRKRIPRYHTIKEERHRGNDMTGLEASKLKQFPTRSLNLAFKLGITSNPFMNRREPRVIYDE